MDRTVGCSLDVNKAANEKNREIMKSMAKMTDIGDATRLLLYRSIDL